MPPKGRPPKKKRNISGLKNQPAVPPLITESAGENVDICQDQDHDRELDDPFPQDMKDITSSEQEDNLDSDFESDHKWKGLTS